MTFGEIRKSRRYKIIVSVLAVVFLFFAFGLDTHVFYTETGYIEKYFYEHNMSVEYIGSDNDSQTEGYPIPESMEKYSGNHTIYFYRWKDTDNRIVTAVCLSECQTSGFVPNFSFRRVVLCDVGEVIADKILSDTGDSLDVDNITFVEALEQINHKVTILNKQCKKYNTVATIRIKIKKDGVVNSFECRNDYTKEDIRKELNTWNIL